MTTSIIYLIIIAFIYLGLNPRCSSILKFPWVETSIAPQVDDTIGMLFKEQRSGVQVSGEGIVTLLLSDDLDGSRHQRFILRLKSGQTLLVAHNIDLAPRLSSLKVGDAVGFFGVYEWNEKGGVVHWTHHDPDGDHQAGWLKHDGVIFQ